MSTFCDIQLPLEDRREGKVRVSYRIDPAPDDLEIWPVRAGLVHLSSGFTPRIDW